MSPIGFRAFLLCGSLLLSWIPMQTLAAEEISAVRGNFIYSEGHHVLGAADKNISYQVEATVYNGVDAWRIAWNCDRINAVHFIRRSDGAPLYVKRINYTLHRTVEIKYSLDSNKPHVYSRITDDETVIRRIHQTPDLKDLGTLPQMLSGLALSEDKDEMHFSGIDYDSGHVYPLLAKRVGYTTVKMMGESVRCAIYEVNLDSWKAAFNPSVEIKVPTKPGLANFAMYSGPDPAGSGKKLTLRMLSRDGDVAALQTPFGTPNIH